MQEVKDGINRGDGIQESAAAADDGKLPGEAQDSVCENVDEDDALHGPLPHDARLLLRSIGPAGRCRIPP